MKKNLLHLIFITFLFPVGEAGAVFLLIAPGASATATGEAQVAKADDAYASYYNPAGLGFQKKSGMAGMHVNWLPSLADDLYYEFLAYKFPTSFGTLGGHLIFLNLGEQMATDEIGNELGKFKSYMWAFTTSYGVKLTKSSSVGASFKVFHQKLADAATASEQGDPYSTDFAFDVGYLKSFGSHGNKFNFGLSITNIGPPIDFVDQAQADPSPTNLKMGLYKEFRINDYNKVNFMFDINRLMVAKYPSMDRDEDGIIDNTREELGYADPWYKAIITCWLDDWYYKFDRDYDGDLYIGGHEEIHGEFRAFTGHNFDDLYDADGTGNATMGYYSFGQSTDWRFQNVGTNPASFYHNGYNMTSVGYLDPADTFTDLNDDGIWTPAEPFFDVGDGVFSSNDFENFVGSTDISDYQYICEHQNVCSGEYYWIYYNAQSGSIVEVQLSPEYDNDGNVVYDTNNQIIYSDEIIGVDFGDGVYDEAIDGIATAEFVDWNGDGQHNLAEDYVDVNGNGSYNTAYSPYGGDESHQKEVGSADDYSFSDELKELIANFGLEYWYTDNFVLRAGYIYDREGNIMNPTFGAGIRFDKYGFDFGYTAGKKDHARANTMFFSMSMDL